jgi:hypothetical protein
MRTQFLSTYGATEYEVSADLKESPYYGKYPSVRSLDLLPYYSTVDDPVIMDIARQLDDQIPERDDLYRASVALQFVQDNITYALDSVQYGVEDLWSVPVMTLASRFGDCDCMANLFVSLAYNMHLDVISVIVTKHMFGAACIDGAHGVSYLYNGKRYYHMESTDRLPAAGRYWQGGEKVEGMAAPAVPVGAFLGILTDDPGKCR